LRVFRSPETSIKKPYYDSFTTVFEQKN